MGAHFARASGGPASRVVSDPHCEVVCRGLEDFRSRVVRGAYGPDDHDASLRAVIGCTPEMQLSVEEVAKHNTAEDCWIILHGGQVFDVTEFLDVHPGGKRMLLTYAGKDATAVFEKLHSPTVFKSVASKYRIGTVGEIIPARPPGSAPSVPSRPTEVGAGPAGALGGDRDTPTASVLPAPEKTERLNWRIQSPFPSNTFDDSGLEAVRFKWSQVDQFIQRDDAEAEDFKLRSYLRPLDLSRDWIHVSAPKTYAYQMSIRKRLCEDCPESVLISEPGTLGAQLELLHLLLEWLPVRYPTRFVVDWGAGTVRTLTEGYLHTFLVADYAQCPIRLCCMLVQEEFALMREEPCPPEQDEQEGGIGLQHRFVAGVSCFSFNLVPKRGKVLSEIHHPKVPGFQSDLQHAMTRFLAELGPEPEECRWRSNFGFNVSTDASNGMICASGSSTLSLLRCQYVVV